MSFWYFRSFKLVVEFTLATKLYATPQESAYLRGRVLVREKGKTDETFPSRLYNLHQIFHGFHEKQSLNKTCSLAYFEQKSFQLHLLQTSLNTFHKETSGLHFLKTI